MEKLLQEDKERRKEKKRKKFKLYNKKKRKKRFWLNNGSGEIINYNLQDITSASYYLKKIHKPYKVTTLWDSAILFYI